MNGTYQSGTVRAERSYRTPIHTLPLLCDGYLRFAISNRNFVSRQPTFISDHHLSDVGVAYAVSRRGSPATANFHPPTWRRRAVRARRAMCGKCPSPVRPLFLWQCHRRSRQPEQTSMPSSQVARESMWTAPNLDCLPDGLRDDECDRGWRAPGTESVLAEGALPVVETEE